MTKSMTAYGKAEGQVNNKKITVEIKSINSKTLDLSMRIPNLYRFKEPDLRNILYKNLERGKVDFSIYIDSELPKNYFINHKLAKTYLDELKSLNKDLRLNSNTDYLKIIMRMPDVLSFTESFGDEKEWKYIERIIDKALIELNIFRSNEGKQLEKALQKHISAIRAYLQNIELLEPKRINIIRNKLKKNIKEVIPLKDIDHNRLEQELIYYIEKLDITEEKVRLKSHYNYFLSTLKEVSNGKKLGFIAQEMGREINTIGSKANDASIQRYVVQMKDELEKIKEQILNIL